MRKFKFFLYIKCNLIRNQLVIRLKTSYFDLYFTHSMSLNNKKITLNLVLRLQFLPGIKWQIEWRLRQRYFLNNTSRIFAITEFSYAPFKS